MKKAKSLKFIILSVAFCFSLVLGVLNLNNSADYSIANASYKTDTSKYFDTTASVKYENDNLVVSAKDGETLSIVNPLVISDFGIQIVVPDGAKSLALEIASDSYVLHGNEKEVGKFDKKITNKVLVDFSENSAKLNGESEVTGLTFTGNVVTINVTVLNNVLSANVNGLSLTQTDKEYYKIAGNEKAIGYVSLTFSVDGEEAKDFAIKYIDQSVSDTIDHKQTFTLTDDDVTPANPEFVASDSLYVSSISDDVNNKIVVIDGEEFNLGLTAYSIYGNVKSSDLYAKETGYNSDINEIFVGDDKPQRVILNTKSNVSNYNEQIEIVYDKADVKVTVGKLNVKVLNKDYISLTDIGGNLIYSKKPEYSASDSAINAFKNALIKATKVGDSYVALGKSVEIPSLKDLVKYDYLPYEDLKYTVYVNSPLDENKTSSTMKIRIDVPGEYKFYVMFYDGEKSMESPIDNEEIMKGEDIATSKFVFSFKIEDNAPLVVEANKETAGTNGYVGVRYSAVPFKIEAETYTPTYTLWYNENADATKEDEGWIKVLKKSEVTSSFDEEKEYFSKEDIETINYDGKLDFTPIKAGTYRIDCEVSKGLTADSKEASYFIKVTEVKQKVKPENKWFKNNMVSIIFLGVGTLCLIGILVLLFIKPKERTKKITDED